MLPTTQPGLANPTYGSRKLILVVDDSRMVAQLVKHLVEAAGFSAIIARDGLDGLETARRERPDLIVSDLHMPRMHGLDLVRALRADSETRDIPILILSGNDD